MAEFDLVIRGGTVVDGTGIPKFRADLGIKDGRVAMISGRINGAGAKELDASGCIVAPGADRPPHPLRRPAQLGPLCLPVRPVRGYVADRGAVRLRVRPDPSGRPGPQHADDEPHRGHPLGIHAPGNALGLGDFPRIHGQPGPSGLGRQRRGLGPVLPSPRLRFGHDRGPGNAPPSPRPSSTR